MKIQEESNPNIYLFTDGETLTYSLKLRIPHEEITEVMHLVLSRKTFNDKEEYEKEVETIIEIFNIK